jgi:chromosome segregation ATPase
MKATETQRTAAAIQARRAAADQMLQRISQALRQMRREHAHVTVAAVARRAAVSRTFLYQNVQARALVTAAAAEAGSGPPNAARPDPAEASWRQRALNAEDELKRAHAEVVAQRSQIGALHGRIRDLEHDLPADGIQRILTENHDLRARLRQAAADQRRLEERLAGARDNNRFLDKRVAELEAELADHMTPHPR